MERITERCVGADGAPEVRVHRGVKASEVSEALAQYEDTGLSPDDIRGLLANADLLMNRNACLEVMVGRMKGFSIPCRPGDVAYVIKSTRKGYMLLKYPVADVSVRGEIFLDSGKKLKADRNSVCFSEEEATSKLMKLMRDPSEKGGEKREKFYLEDLTPDELRAKERKTPQGMRKTEIHETVTKHAEESRDIEVLPDDDDDSDKLEDVTFIN